MTQFRPGGFMTLPPVIKNLLIINILVFFAQNTIGKSYYFNMEDLFALHHVKSPLFKPWQIITHLFMHGSISHIFWNMFSLWMFGKVLEDLWGPKRFLTFYFICGIGAAVLHLTFLWFDSNEMLNQYVTLKQSPTTVHIIDFFNTFHLNQYQGAEEVLNNYKNNPDDVGAYKEAIEIINQFVMVRLDQPTIGASGAISGVLAAFLYLFPNTDLYLYFLFPIKAKWLGLVYFGQELYFAISNSSDDNIAHWAHLGGALVGFLLILTWNKRNRQNFY